MRRILAISDIHGENTKLLNLLEKAEYESTKDLLIICGDMIDRGTENLATIETCKKLRQKGAILLKGNHEQFAQESVMDMLAEIPSEALQFWVTYNGGVNTYDEIERLPRTELTKLLKFLKTLPLYFATEKYIFVHAGANVSKPIEKNIENEIVWTKDSFYNRPAYSNKIMVFGHIPTWLLYPYPKKNKDNHKDAKIWIDEKCKDKIGIDCGSVFGGRLAALELPSCREFYV